MKLLVSGLQAKEPLQQGEAPEQHAADALDLRCMCGLCAAHFQSEAALTWHAHSAEHQQRLARLAELKTPHRARARHSQPLLWQRGDA